MESRNIQLSESFLSEPPGDSPFVQVIRRHFHFYTIACRDFNPTLAHLAANRCKDDMIVSQRDTKHCAGKDGGYNAFHFNMLLFLLVHLIFLAVCTTGHFCPADYSGLMREKKGARLEKP